MHEQSLSSRHITPPHPGVIYPSSHHSNLSEVQLFQRTHKEPLKNLCVKVNEPVLQVFDLELFPSLLQNSLLSGPPFTNRMEDPKRVYSMRKIGSSEVP